MQLQRQPVLKKKKTSTNKEDVKLSVLAKSGKTQPTELVVRKDLSVKNVAAGFVKCLCDLVKILEKSTWEEITCSGNSHKEILTLTKEGNQIRIEYAGLLSGTKIFPCPYWKLAVSPGDVLKRHNLIFKLKKKDLNAAGARDFSFELFGKDYTVSLKLNNTSGALEAVIDEERLQRIEEGDPAFTVVMGLKGETHLLHTYVTKKAGHQFGKDRGASFVLADVAGRKKLIATSSTLTLHISIMLEKLPGRYGVDERSVSNAENAKKEYTSQYWHHRKLLQEGIEDHCHAEDEDEKDEVVATIASQKKSLESASQKANKAQTFIRSCQERDSYLKDWQGLVERSVLALKFERSQRKAMVDCQEGTAFTKILDRAKPQFQDGHIALPPRKASGKGVSPSSRDSTTTVTSEQWTAMKARIGTTPTSLSPNDAKKADACLKNLAKYLSPSGEKRSDLIRLPQIKPDSYLLSDNVSVKVLAGNQKPQSFQLEVEKHFKQGVIQDMAALEEMGTQIKLRKVEKQHAIESLLSCGEDALQDTEFYVNLASNHQSEMRALETQQNTINSKTNFEVLTEVTSLIGEINSSRHLGHKTNRTASL